jgi:hypothetical protein
MQINRRRFLNTSAAITSACVVDLSFLARVSHAAASDTQINPDEVLFGPETDRLLRLIRTTTREESVPAFAREVKAGLSYRQFLTALFLAAVENGDPHQVAQVYGAHRISSDARVEERLLPLFWVLNRIKQESENGGAVKPALKPFQGALPTADQAAGIFREAMLRSDKAEVERAALALARDHGARHAMHRLWEFAGRNLGGNLGHPAIALANSLRALDAMGWQHAEVALRYVARYIGGYKGDKTYASNLERVKRTLPGLPTEWTRAEGNRGATLDLYHLLHAGKADESCDLICSQLLSNKVKAGSIWDAISVAAADVVSRHKTGGAMLGGQIHAVTTTNALRYGFNLVDDPGTKLVNMLQAAGVICDFYVGHPAKQGNLRNMSLLDLKGSDRKPAGSIQDVFELLPFKAREYVEQNPDERTASDRACRMAFDLLLNVNNHAAFMQSARSFLCVKASLDPHDIKYPAAVFEDAHLVSPEWRPYLLASSVHALHGNKSNDTAVLVKVRDALS